MAQKNKRIIYIKHRMPRTSRFKRKSVPRKGWSKEKPSQRERTVMRKKCGSKCFLGPGTSFPICKKHTCSVSKKGVSAAYVRAREWKYNKTASKAKRLLK